MRLSIVIVTHNDTELLEACLQSVVISIKNISAEILVIDNNSSNSKNQLIRSSFPQVRHIILTENLGFAKANNIGIRISTGDYVLILNPDTELSAAALPDCIAYMESHPTVGIVGPQLVKPDGNFDWACRRMFPSWKDYFFRGLGLDKAFPKNRMFGHYNLSFLSTDVETQVEAVAGAFAMARRKAIDHVGLFDERFFIYGEDLDWCYRFVMRGHKILYLPYVKVIHHKGFSTTKQPVKMAFHFFRSNWLLYKKHIAPNTNLLIGLLIWTTMFFHFILKAVIGLLKQISIQSSNFQKPIRTTKA